MGPQGTVTLDPPKGGSQVLFEGLSHREGRPWSPEGNPGVLLCPQRVVAGQA